MTNKQINVKMWFATLMFAATSSSAFAQQVTVQMADGVQLSLMPLADNALRIVRGTPSTMQELTYVTPTAKVKYKVKDTDDRCMVTLPRMSVTVDKGSGRISYSNAEGHEVLNELAYSLTASTVQDEPTFIASATFDSPADEHLYGLGQFQDGQFDVRGISRRLTQVNTQISIPFYTSSRGYSVLWNNYGMTEFNPCSHSVVMKRSSEGKVSEVDVTSTEGGKKEARQESVFTADIDITQEGDYTMLLDVGQTMARRHNIVIDGKTVVDMKNPWLPPTTSTILHLCTGRHTVTANLTSNDHPTLYYNIVDTSTTLRSPVAENVNYTVFVGNADECISTYHHLTGTSPLPPAWVFGYVHCRERFHSSDEILSTAHAFRQKQLPMDVMVQDWQWWGKYGWNAMRFDEEHYPDPALLVDSLHRIGSRLMLSVWSKIDKNSAIGKEALQHGYYIDGTDWIDFFNPDAADYYSKTFTNNLLQPYKIDCWWQDAVEPENDDLVGRRVCGGTIAGERLRNTYPLMVSKTVYELNRREIPLHRTSILTRCAAPGIQRYGSFLWSGDVGHDWQTLRYQLRAGLSLAAAGHPWWTYDAGGFFRPHGQYTDHKYHERFIRWLQISTFLPMMRVHGYMTDTEFWHFGEVVEREARTQLELRYRLFPYIYTLAYGVTQGRSMIRPLIMDYTNDEQALSISDEYMFGSAFLVAPVMTEDATSRLVYLPNVPGGWYNIHDNHHYTPGHIKAPVTLSQIPVYAKAGTILVTAQPMQTTSDYRPDTLNITIYPGTDGAFTLYEDDGVTQLNEQGEYCIIPMTWDNAHHRLTIDATHGSYTNMPRSRTLNINVIGGKSLTVNYDGRRSFYTIP